MASLLLAAVAFVGTHFLLAHPLRQAMVNVVGERGFQAVFSLVAAVTIAWMGSAYYRAPATSPLWQVGNGLWGAATVVMLLASVLLMGSLIRNPALPTGGGPAKLPERAQGVFAITRHPMMWAFALWGLCHIAVYPLTKNIIVAVAIIVLSLLGAAMQDQKKQRLEPALWPAWEAKTSYLPFAAIASGKARAAGPWTVAILGGTLIWLAATWAHMPISGWAAGIWRWVR